MDDKEFRALINLLEDDDPNVAAHVENKLLALGPAGVARLEGAWEQEPDPKVQERIEEIIHHIQLGEITKQLFRWRKEGGRDLMEGWILLTRFQYASFDDQKYRDEVNRLTNKIWLEINEKMTVFEKFKVFNHVLFVMENYDRNLEDPVNPANNYFNYLIDTRKGNSFSLSMLYLIIARKLDINVYGVILPNYFVLLYKDEKHHIYLDVFNGGIFFTRKELELFLRKLRAADNPSYYKPVSNIMIILQLINNLIVAYEEKGEPKKAAKLRKLLDDIDIRF